MIGLLAIAGTALGFGMMSDAEKQKAEDSANIELMRRLLGVQAKYLVKDKYIEQIFQAYNPEEAANKFVQRRYSSYNKTYWIRVQARELDSDEAFVQITAPVDPTTPDCTEDEHSWTESSVRGHRGGVLVVETCDHCKAKKITDTYAQDAETGEMGLTSIEYQEPEEEWSYDDDRDYDDEE